MTSKSLVRLNVVGNDIPERDARALVQALQMKTAGWEGELREMEAAAREAMKEADEESKQLQQQGPVEGVGAETAKAGAGGATLKEGGGGGGKKEDAATEAQPATDEAKGDVPELTEAGAEEAGERKEAQDGEAVVEEQEPQKGGCCWTLLASYSHVSCTKLACLY
jgi:hypothetical protein